MSDNILTFKPKNQKIYIEITKESGEDILTENFQCESDAQDLFNKLETIRYPHTYKNLTMNLSEFDNTGTIGKVRLIVEIKGERHIRRELYRKA